MKDIIVKKSKIHGLGVFTGRNFKKGEIVIRWDMSHRLTKKDAARLDEKEKEYVATLNGKCILMQPPARYVNHSCDANTCVKNFCDVARRNIKKGEEITSDYRKDTSAINMKCNCGSKNCLHLIKK